MADGGEPLSSDVDLMTMEQRKSDADLQVAVNEEDWEQAVNLVKCGKCSHEQRQWAIEAIISQQEEEDHVCDVITLCAPDRVVPVFSLLIERGLWDSVDKLVSYAKRDDLRHRLVDEAVRHGDDDRKIGNIVTAHCVADEVDTVLSHLIRRGRWEAVMKLVICDICTAEQRHWALEELVKHAADGIVREVIRLHGDDQADNMWSHVVRRGLGNSAYHLMEMSQCSDEQRAMAVDVAAKHADWGRQVSSYLILEDCTADQADSVWTHLISRGMWDSIYRFMGHSKCSDEQRRRILEKAINHAGDELMSDMIKYCAADQVDTMLSQLITRSLWRTVDKLMKSPQCSEEQRQWAGDLVFRAAAHRLHSKDMDKILSHYIGMRQWRALAILLNGITCSDDQRRWVLEKITQHADENVVYDVLHQCPTDRIDTVLSHLITRYMWRGVSEVLERGVSPTLHRWALDEARRHANDEDFAHYMLSHYVDEDLDQVITRLVSRGRWETVGEVLTRGVSDAQHRWAVEEAGKHTDDNDFVRYILPHCVDEVLDQVITHLVSRGMWRAVGEVLTRGVSGAQRRWVVEEASKHADEYYFLETIVPHCLSGGLDQVITLLVSRGMWRAVGKVLTRGVSDAQHRWAVEEASKHADDDDFVENIVPHCLSEGLEQVITHLVSRGLWRAVGEVLKLDVNASHHGWAVEQAIQNANESEFLSNILHHCVDEELGQVIRHLVSRGMWRVVGEVLKCGVSDTHHRWAVEEARKHADDDNFERYILCHCSADELADVLPSFVANGRHDISGQVFRGAVYDTLLTWATSGQDNRSQDTLFWKLVRSCRVGLCQALGVYKAVTQDTRFNAYDLARRLNRVEEQATTSGAAESMGWSNRRRWHRTLCEVLFTSLSHALCYVVCSDDKEYRDSTQETRKSVADVYEQLTSCIHDNTNSVEDVRLGIIRDKEKWTLVFTELATTHQTDPLFFLHFLQGLNSYQASRRGEDDDIILLTLFAVLPLFPEMQSVALRIMLREKRWDIISQACRSHLWEHDRRLLFKVAVELSQWSVVKLWADHGLQEDQRIWAMEEAFKESQWEAYLLLADHGLTETQLMGVHYNVAKYGDWSTVLQMFERGGDVSEVKMKLIISRGEPKRNRIHEIDEVVLEHRLKQLHELEMDLKTAYHRYPQFALDRSIWSVVLYQILQGHTKYIIPTMQKARVIGAWHVVMHLVRLGMTDADREKLFPEMVAEQQWGVCRKLLEYGVSVRLCLELLPQLIEKNQWFLLGLVMKYSVGIDTIRQVMDCAFQRREGTVFWQCLGLVEDNVLSEERCLTLFHLAISRDIWELIKQLLARHDSVGRQYRDIALLEALEQHLWDVVDDCQLHGADINVKDDDDETALHRELRNREWRAVKEIVYHDGDPNLLDKYRYSVLNKLVNDEQWDTLKFVIKYGADIHFPARMGYLSRERLHMKEIYNLQVMRSGGRRRYLYRGKCSPLQGLFDDQQLESIKFTLMWCPDQCLGVNVLGETALHLACLTEESRTTLHYLMARKVDPLAVTYDGLSALAYAVLGECPEVMVATCIRFGFSTHQPSLTILPERMALEDLIKILQQCIRYHFRRVVHKLNILPVTTPSPLLNAMLRPRSDDINTRSILNMLCESGACRHRELFWVYTLLRRVLESPRERPFLNVYEDVRLCVGPYLVFLKQATRTPRSLKSSCRLTISHCIGLRGRLDHRQLKVWQLDLSEKLKNYVLFKDLWYGLCLER